MAFVLSSFASLTGCFVESPEETDRPSWIEEETADDVPNSDGNEPTDVDQEELDEWLEGGSTDDQNDGDGLDDGSGGSSTPDPIDISATPSSGTTFFHPDYTGNISYTTDIQGNIKSRMIYKPYGDFAFYGEKKTDDIRFKFNTHEEDKTGLSYFNARYYDSDTGRFTTADPTVPDKTGSQGYNRYMFVAGNPISFVDTSGYNWITDGLGKIAESVGGWVKDNVDQMGNGLNRFANNEDMSGWRAGLAALNPVNAMNMAIGGLAGNFGKELYGRDASFKDVVRDFWEAALAIGVASLLPINGAYLAGLVWGVYMARVIIYGGLIGVPNMIAYGITGEERFKRRAMDWTFGKEHRSDGTHNIKMRSRPWILGDIHTTGINADNPIIGDQSPLMVLLDITFTHQTSVLHDEGCSRQYYSSFNPIGMVTSSFSSTLGFDNLGYYGNSYGSTIDSAIIGSSFGPAGTIAGGFYGAYY